MLSKAHRVVSADDFKATVRTGRRGVEQHVVAYVRSSGPDAAARFGFIITKNVGGAVVRNRLRRRLRALGAAILASGELSEADVVIRALPGSAQLSWPSLQTEVVGAVERGAHK